MAMVRSRTSLLASQKIYQKKRRIRLIKIILFVFLLLGFIAGFVWASYRPEFAIENIIVEGGSSVPNEEVVTAVERQLAGSYWYGLSRKNIVFYPRKSVEDAVKEKSLRIAHVESKRILWNSIVVTVTDRVPVGVWCGVSLESTTKCYLLDRTGFIFDYAPEFSGTTYMKFYGAISSEYPLGASMAFVQNFTRAYEVATALPAIELIPASVVLESEYYRIYLKQDTQIRATYFDTDEKIIPIIASLLEQSQFSEGKIFDAEYIDLRYGNKIFYKFKGKEVSSE